MAIGEKQAKGSGGLFKPDDWQCMMCSNINWAKRDTCNACQHPKEGKVENRAGLGGGYKENEGVEYKQHREDDVYDEVRTIHDSPVAAGAFSCISVLARCLMAGYSRQSIHVYVRVHVSRVVWSQKEEIPEEWRPGATSAGADARARAGR